MLLTTIALRPPQDLDKALSASEIIDLLWLNAATSDGVQHIHARTSVECIEIAFFTVASDQSISDYIVLTICERAIRSVPAFRGWLIHQP